jgi:hypothetical protein
MRQALLRFVLYVEHHDVLFVLLMLVFELIFRCARWDAAESPPTCGKAVDRKDSGNNARTIVLAAANDNNFAESKGLEPQSAIADARMGVVMK